MSDPDPIETIKVLEEKNKKEIEKELERSKNEIILTKQRYEEKLLHLPSLLKNEIGKIKREGELKKELLFKKNKEETKSGIKRIRNIDADKIDKAISFLEKKFLHFYG